MMPHSSCASVDGTSAVQRPSPEFVAALCKRKMPTMLVLDIINYCNLDCVHCPQKTIQKAPNFVPRRLSLEQIQRLACETAEANDTILVRVVGDGEPLLHPDALDILALFAAQSHVITEITTNGLLLTRQCAGQLLEMGVDIVSVSLDALTAPTYDSVRRGGNFAQVLQNIFVFLELRKTKQSPAKLLVSFIEQNENCHEAAVFRQFWEPLADFVIIRRLHAAGSKVKQAEATLRSCADTHHRYPCPHPFKRLAVNFNGSISYCAHDWDDSAVIGNIADIGTAQAWGSESLACIRQDLLHNRLQAGAACHGCKDWASTRWDFGYELLVDTVLNDASRKLLPPLPVLIAPNTADTEGKNLETR